jgi:hypothetical protein
MPETVVDVFEAIEIHERDRDPRVVAARGQQGLFEAVL